ncbi:Kinetochore Ndc80 complex subunit Spc25 [Echinococcus multilocularis]|uniref:Kinetochore protein SPC25 n=1 Tax=Echinococcus multilocularis TaxID=6211 RepID=A0A068YI85_ECHMU|nr:Kinetochore Ndc80 complex subunit Spc25 [Echinococcus multilocularis]
MTFRVSLCRLCLTRRSRVMTEETLAMTTFLFGAIPDAPDAVLRRFQRLIALEQQQQESDITTGENGREWMVRLSAMRKNWCEKEVSFERRNARHQKQLKEVEYQETELRRLRDWRDSLKEQLESLSRQNANVKYASTTDSEIRRLQERISFYERTFGLEIRRTRNHNNVQVVMRGCCEDDYDLLSYVILRFNADSTPMELIKCNPPVTDVEKLVEHFNKAGDFRSFLLVLRDRFVKYHRTRKKRKN